VKLTPGGGDARIEEDSGDIERMTKKSEKSKDICLE